MSSTIVGRCNRSTIQHFNTTYQAIIGRHLGEVFFADSDQAGSIEVGSCVREVFLGQPGKCQGIEFRNEETQFPGLEGWYQVSSYPLWLEEDLRGMIYSIRDITERKLAQMELLRQKQFFEALVVNSPVAIVLVDKEQKIYSCNPAFEKLFGYSQAEVFGGCLDDLISTEADRSTAIEYSQQAQHSLVHATASRRRRNSPRRA